MKLTKLFAVAALTLTSTFAFCGLSNAALPQPKCTYGKIVEVGDNSIVVKGEGDYAIVKVMLNVATKTQWKPTAELQGSVNKDLGLNVSLEQQKTASGTIIVNGNNGRPLSSKKLTVGKEVFAYYDGNVTKSYPAQAQGEAVVLVTNPDKAGQYFIVDKVELSKDGKAAIVTNTNGDLVATIPGRACSAYREIKPGSKLLIWSKIMTLSLPAKTVATKARILE